MNLADLFDLSLIGRAAAVALEWLGGDSVSPVLTFSDLDLQSNRLAQLLYSRGLKKGDRLCVYLPNRPEVVLLYLACVKLGVIFVPINVLYRQREVSLILEDSEPKAVVAEQKEVHGSASWAIDELVQAASGHSAERPATPVDGDCPAALVYTSGTTGRSKGAVLSHNNFAANALNLVSCWQFSAADRLLLSLPLFHVHGLGNGLHCWLLSGCRLGLSKRFSRDHAAEDFMRFRPTVFFGVPTMYVRLLNIAEETAGEIGQFMRLFVSGSAPLPEAVFDHFELRFGHRILERYGMTETLMNFSNPYLGERRPGTVGRPLPGVSVRLLDDFGELVPDEETGEIYLRGANVFQEYWKQPVATAEVFKDGYFRTGDLASRSRDGYFTLRGRRSDVIISRGFNVYPREIEEFLEEQPEVAEAAVVGVPDAVLGQRPVAFVVLRRPVEGAELQERCRADLAAFKVPADFHVVEALPRNALGKIQKHLLRGSSEPPAGS
ncbi:MAG: AMP-binding protein [Acidobacteriota bacterium]